MNSHKENLIWIVVSSAAIILAGTLWHFLYDWFGNFKLFALIAPVNESVWEHLKLTLYPTVIIWFVLSPYFKATEKISGSKAALCSVVSMATANLCILGLHYIFKGGFDFESAFIDIGSYIIGIFAGQTVSTCQILPIADKGWSKLWGWSILFLAVVIYGTFTLYPPDFPIFVSP